MIPNRLRRPLVLVALAGALVAAAFVAAPSSAAAQTKGIPPAPSRWCTDEAGFLSRTTVDALDARLENYERQTGHQVLVWIGRTIGPGQSLEDWAVRAFEAWKVGRKDLDDGLVLFILAEDHKIRIEVGYGLEDKVPDAYAFRVINNILAPGIRDGRPDEAVDAAVTAIIGYISGNAEAAGEAPPSARRGHAGSTAKGIFGGLIILFLIILFITNPSLAFLLLLNMLGGGGRGGRGGGGWGGGGWGGGGGGGFSGGGGSSGGGGASGGW